MSGESKVVDLFSQRRNFVPPVFGKLLAGAMAGIVTKTSTAPLERVKILMQTQGMLPSRANPIGSATAKRHDTLVRTAMNVVREDGVFALWRGNGANCIRVVPVYALKFTMNDVFRDFVRSPGQKDYELSTLQLMQCGTLAGLFQQIVTFPLEFVRTRLSLQEGSKSEKKHYRGVVDCLKTTIREEGFFSMYKGLGPTIISGAPYVGLQMTFYTKWKHVIGSIVGDDAETLTKLLSGSLAGLSAQLITYPGDTIRRRMISNGSRGRARVYKNSFDCAQKILAQEGSRGFFKGVGANVVRCIPAAAIQFFTYDLFSSCLVGSAS